MWESILHADRRLLLYLNQLGHPDWDFLWLTLTRISFWIPVYTALGYFIYRRHKKYNPWKPIAFGLLLLAIIMLFTEWIKGFTLRLRPVNDPLLNDSLRILTSADSYSFFSGHASASFAVTVFGWLLLRNTYRWAILFFIWPFLFSYSRMYLGLHYPTDILAGALTGAFLGYLTYRIFTAHSKPYNT